ncbi:hypothetical protein [Marinobacterium arenosum]|uniref:hypothetical protein n=1 Tax=Marinobacterium arenosum TaxID=2862496 RepID=UPI001C955FBD|nr:hypothetical protein [Marinobacterium arenosum]MBY4678035.1 hypothetical protein [Marinobacterium arenosum]
MTEQRHPDIEIYVKDRSIEQIEQWLDAIGDSLQKSVDQGLVHEYRLEINGSRVPVMIHEKVAGKAWFSVWFKQNPTDWPQDLDCAKAASEAMATQIRCIAGGWNDGDEPDEYWKVENGQQEKIVWRT